MTQVIFNEANIEGYLHFQLEMDEGTKEAELKFKSFEVLNYYLQDIYKKRYSDLFKERNIRRVEFEGISFKAVQGGDRFSLDVTDGWKRVSMIFDDKKHGQTSMNKLKRIQDIINE